MSRLFRLAVVMFTLLAIADPVAGLADQLWNVGHQLRTPQRVGIAFETNPPPLASLKGVLGTKPGIDDLDLYVRSFAQVVFESKFPDLVPAYLWILKFAKPLRINITDDVEPRHKELLVQVAGNRSDITGLPFEIVGEDDDLRVWLAGRLSKNPFCFIVKPDIGDDGTLLRIEVVASPFMEGNQLLGCFYEDVSQALGVWNDLALTPESMYRSESENDNWYRLTWHDVIMLRTLYDRRILPGMHRDQAMSVVRVVIAELLEELNAPTE